MAILLSMSLTYTYYTHKKILKIKISGDYEKSWKFKIIEIQKQEKKHDKDLEKTFARAPKILQEFPKN